MRLSLIGMSNIGKSGWAKRLAGRGYARIDCDALIEHKLAGELAAAGQRGLRGVADWMGFPDHPDYGRKSALYLTHERQAMRELIGDLRSDIREDIVVDTTGSVIYTGADILNSLRDVTRVVYLEASESYIDELFRRSIAHPKPAIWGDIYAPLPDEAPRRTLQRCYPDLLRERAKRYKEAAHITVPFEQHRDHHGDIIAVIEKLAGVA